jgi:hypothetical protein
LGTREGEGKREEREEEGEGREERRGRLRRRRSRDEKKGPEKWKLGWHWASLEVQQQGTFFSPADPGPWDGWIYTAAESARCVCDSDGKITRSYKLPTVHHDANNRLSICTEDIIAAGLKQRRSSHWMHPYIPYTGGR